MAERSKIGCRLNVKLTLNWQRSAALTDNLTAMSAAIRESVCRPPIHKGSV
jgi:hypothetical protein